MSSTGFHSHFCYFCLTLDLFLFQFCLLVFIPILSTGIHSHFVYWFSFPFCLLVFIPILSTVIHSHFVYWFSFPFQLFLSDSWSILISILSTHINSHFDILVLTDVIVFVMYVIVTKWNQNIIFTLLSLLFFSTN